MKLKSILALVYVLVLSLIAQPVLALQPSYGQTFGDYIITPISLADCNEKEYTVIFNAENLGDAPLNLNLVVVAYDSRGSVKASNNSHYTVRSNGGTARLSSSLTKPVGTVQCKYFLWDSNYVPINVTPVNENPNQWFIGNINGFVSQDSNYEMFLDEAPDLDDFPKGVDDTDLADTDLERAELKNVNITYEDGLLSFSGQLDYFNQTVELISSGDFYKHQNNGEDSQHVEMILAELPASNDFNFVQFKIDKNINDILITPAAIEDSLLTLLLQDNETKRILLFQSSIDSILFDELLSLPMANSLEGMDLSAKLLQLLLVEPNLDGYVEEPILMEGEISSSTEQTIKPRVQTWSKWSNFFSALNKSDKLKGIKFSNYINDASLFTGDSHWYHENVWPYVIVAYISRTNNGYYMQITQCYLTDDNLVIGEGAGGKGTKRWRVAIEFNYENGKLFQYFPSTGIIKDVGIGYSGLHLKDVELNQYGLTDDACFVNRFVDISCFPRPSLLRVAAAIHPATSVAYEAIAALSEYGYLKPGEKEDRMFPKTQVEQYAKYGKGNLVRGIYTTSGSTALTRPGEYIKLSGEVEYYASRGTKCYRSYKYWAYPTIF